MKILVAAEDVTPELQAAIEGTVEWFINEPSMPTEDFIDRMCNDYGGDEWDIENLDTPAVKRIMRIARSIRREALL